MVVYRTCTKPVQAGGDDEPRGIDRHRACEIDFLAFQSSKHGFGRQVPYIQGGFYMFSHSTNTASFFFVLMAALIFSLSLAGVAWAQEGNTSFGTGALQS